MTLKDFLAILDKRLGTLVINLLNEDYDGINDTDYSATIFCMDCDGSERFKEHVQQIITLYGICRVHEIQETYTSTYIFINKNKEI